jgi:acetoin utilization protein AcuB
LSGIKNRRHVPRGGGGSSYHCRSGRRAALPGNAGEFTMLVRNRMSQPVVSIRDDADFQEGLALMQQYRIRRLPVVDARDRVVGIVTERDLLVAATRYQQSKVEIAEIMSRPVITVTPDVQLDKAASQMLIHKIGGVPVVDGERLVGVITDTDVFRRYVELHDVA